MPPNMVFVVYISRVLLVNDLLAIL